MLVIHARSLFLAARVRHAETTSRAKPQHVAPSLRQRDFVRLRAPLA